MNTVVLYHGNCFDGIAAAWVTQRKFPDATCIPAIYGASHRQAFYDAIGQENLSLERIKDTRIIMVDYSSSREDMEKLYQLTDGNFQCIDHHKTAQLACEGLDFCIFDMEESGASLAWKTYFPDEPMPRLIKYVKDRDLWQFRLAQSHQVNAFIHSYPMTLEAYGGLVEYLENDENFFIAQQQGVAILRYKEQMVDNICMTAEIIDGIPTVNTSVLFSEVPERLLEIFPTAPYARYYYDRIKDGIRQWGLRSKGDFDVSEVAKDNGGGGHKNAAGFTERLL